MIEDVHVQDDELGARLEDLFVALCRACDEGNRRGQSRDKENLGRPPLATPR